MADSAGMKDSGVRVAEAALIAAIGKVIDAAISVYKDRRTATDTLEAKIDDLHERLKKLEKRRGG